MFLDLCAQALFMGPMFFSGFFFVWGWLGVCLFLLGGGQYTSASSSNSKAEDATCNVNVTTVAFICFPLARFFPPSLLLDFFWLNLLVFVVLLQSAPFYNLSEPSIFFFKILSIMWIEKEAEKIYLKVLISCGAM